VKEPPLRVFHIDLEGVLIVRISSDPSLIRVLFPIVVKVLPLGLIPISKRIEVIEEVFIRLFGCLVREREDESLRNPSMNDGRVRESDVTEEVSCSVKLKGIEVVPKFRIPYLIPINVVVHNVWNL
jgi:hypothetical protein